MSEALSFEENPLSLPPYKRQYAHSSKPFLSTPHDMEEVLFHRASPLSSHIGHRKDPKAISVKMLVKILSEARMMEVSKY